MVRDARLMAEDEKFDKYRLKLKVISLFFVVFSVFILVNASIGASSAPFYEKYTDCSKLDLTSECKELLKYTSALYGFEVCGSILLVSHGLIGMTLLEYIKKTWLIRTLNYYTKAALFLYSIDALLRCAMYFKIRNLMVPVDEDNYDENFGGFLAVYCENKAVGVIVTCVLLGAYGLCFLSTCFLWKMSADLHKTALAVDEEKNRAPKKRGSSTSKNDSESPKSTKAPSIIEEESMTAFKDFDYNTKRARKASKVLLSINQKEEDDDEDEDDLLVTQDYRSVQ
jgi:hypothetical protein